MYRMILSAAALLIAIAAQPAIADDASMCESMKDTRNKDTNDNIIAACSRLLALNPNRASAYNVRGFAYVNLGDYDRGISDFDQAIRFDPKLAAAYVNRGGTYYFKGDYDRAVSDLDQAQRFGPLPEGPRRALERAKVLLAMRPNLGAQAKASSGTAAAVAPPGPGDARLCALADGSADSINACGRLLMYNPKDSAAYSSRGDSWLLRNQIVRAIADFDQVLRLDPANAHARDRRELNLFAD